MKRCPQCELDKPDTEYGTRKRVSTSGEVKIQLRSWCRACELAKTLRTPLEVRRVQGAAWARENPDAVKAKAQKYRKAHPEVNQANCAKYHEKNRDQILTKARAHYAANHEEVREKAKDYYYRNPEKFQVWRHTRRARLAKAVSTLTSDQWEAILELFDGACAYCGHSDGPITMDHVLPISRGGGHTEDNVVPACQSCNASKNAKTPDEWGWPAVVADRHKEN